MKINKITMEIRRGNKGRHQYKIKIKIDIK